jgi:hypothetical protein
MPEKTIRAAQSRGKLTAWDAMMAGAQIANDFVAVEGGNALYRPAG